MGEPQFKIVTSFAVPKGTIYFVPEIERRQIIAPDGTVVRDELIYWKTAAAVLLNVKEPEN